MMVAHRAIGVGVAYCTVQYPSHEDAHSVHVALDAASVAPDASSSPSSPPLQASSSNFSSWGRESAHSE